MDCGVPFCQIAISGCPIDNLIPEWNDLVYQGRWREALDRLHKTNNFPEFTGRACPAPCEGACVLGITDPAGHDQEHRERDHRPRLRRRLGHARAAAERARARRSPSSAPGPAGLAAAAQLNKAGHTVTVYERADRIGGLLMYGIPNMKLDKGVVERRVDLLRDEGVKFVTNADVGKESSIVDRKAARRERRAAARHRRDQAARSADPRPRAHGIHFAMEFLHANTKSLLDSEHAGRQLHLAPKARTSSSSAAATPAPTASARRMRHGCKSLVNFELLPQPPAERARRQPLAAVAADLPHRLRPSRGRRQVRRRPARPTASMSKEFVGDEDGSVAGIRTVQVEWNKVDGQWKLERSCRHARSSGPPICPARDGLPRPRAIRQPRCSASSTTRARNYKAPARQVRDQRAEGLRRRRLPPRPIARRLGDQRRPRRRARDR